MLLSWTELSKILKCKESVLQIGAHLAEEHDHLVMMGFKEFYYVEPLRDNYLYLKHRFQNKPHIEIFNFAISDTDGFKTFFKNYPTYISSFFELEDSLLNSNIEFIQEEQISVECMKLSSLMHLLKSSPSLLICDTQGSEMQIINSGLVEANIPYVILELEYGNLYKKTPKAHIIKQIMNNLGYELLLESKDETKLWSDALFQKIR
jgi:FkbM family methyltransferase